MFEWWKEWATSEREEAGSLTGFVGRVGRRFPGLRRGRFGRRKVTGYEEGGVWVACREALEELEEQG
jgi:hypothetical protein